MYGDIRLSFEKGKPTREDLVEKYGCTAPTIGAANCLSVCGNPVCLIKLQKLLPVFN